MSGNFPFLGRKNFPLPHFFSCPSFQPWRRQSQPSGAGVKKRKHRGESEKLAPPVRPPRHSPGRGSDIKPGWRTLKLAILLLSWAAPPHCRGDYFCDLKCLTTSHDLRATGESVGCEQACGGVGLKRPQGETQLFHGCARGAHLLPCGSQPAQGTVRNGG